MTKIQISTGLLITLLTGCLNYSSKMNSKEIISLPKPNLKSNMTVEQAIAKRRSIRKYANKPLTLEQLSQILWAAQGKSGPERHHHAAPSAGGIHPLQLYIIATNVSELNKGIYKYDPQKNSLSLKHSNHKRDNVHQAAYGQSAILSAPVILVFVAQFQKTMNKYGPKAKAFVYTDLGHSAENVYLQATALGIGTVAMGGIEEKKITEILELPEDEDVIYLMPLGIKE